MADLGSLTTDKRLAFTKYVTENKRFSEIEFEVEKNKTAILYTLDGGNLVSSQKEYKSGTKLKIIDKKITEFGKLKLANVKINNSVGFIQINTIRKPTGGNGTHYEDEVVDAITNYILSAGGTIDIKLKGDSIVYTNISYAIKVDGAIKTRAGVKGDPKADIILCRDIKYPIHESSIFISHKKAGGPEAFQQYGGLSEQSGDHIYNHQLVQKFLGEVVNIIGDNNKLPAPVLGKFNDDTLACMSIFGPEYGKKFSLQHTQIIGQGLPRFTNDGKITTLDFDHMSLSGDLSHFKDGYTPVFGATYREGRGFTYRGKRYNGARVAIYPQKLVATRSGLIITEIK